MWMWRWTWRWRWKKWLSKSLSKRPSSKNPKRGKRAARKLERLERGAIRRPALLRLAIWGKVPWFSFPRKGGGNFGIWVAKGEINGGRPPPPAPKFGFGTAP